LRRLLFVGLGLVLLPAHAGAQTCNVSMSVNQCIKELGRDAAEQRMRDGLATELATTNTGGQTAAASSTDDFNPKVEASLNAIGTSEDPGDGLTMSVTDPFRDLFRQGFFGDDGVAEAHGQHHKIVVTLNKAELFAPLDELVTDPQVKDELKGSLNDFSNVTVDFRLSTNSKSRGRDIQQHIDLVSAIQQVVFEQLTTNRKTLFDALEVRNQIIQDHATLNLDQPIDGQVPAAEAVAIIGSIQKAHTEQIEFLTTYDATFRRNGLDGLLKLVNNQPQLVFSVKANIRDTVVGPDEYSAKLVYEFGGANVNRYRAYAAEKNCASDPFLCVSRYLASAGSSVDQGRRLAASIEYTSHESYEFASGAYQLSLPSDRSLVAKLAYGQYVTFGARASAATNRSRFDLSVSFEDVSNDSARQNRAIASATFAQEIGSGLFLTLGVQWANKPEFRGPVDHEVSALAGINYKLTRQP
jgi:hypothetical protein